jgi:hypothetical protein
VGKTKKILEAFIDFFDRLSYRQAGLIITIVGVMVFASSLTNGFVGDDNGQILKNVPVHSITNIATFFKGGSFYVGDNHALWGAYYRPLMVTSFSVLYTLFGPHALYFHLFQLVLIICITYFIFVFFRYTFKPAASLLLALLFMAYPINSQAIYSIAAFQELLFMFFGLAGILSLIKYKSNRGLVLSGILFFLALLSKETALCFIAVAFIYMFFWDRTRFQRFTIVALANVIGWLALRINAVGFAKNVSIAPIDRLDFTQRVSNDPQIIWFYIQKLFFPDHLASGYYWVYPGFSVRHFFLPLLLDLCFIFIAVRIILATKRYASKAQFWTLLFFAAWAVLGILPVLQIYPLDMTVCENWMLFSTLGILGFIGVAIQVLLPRKYIIYIPLVGLAIIMMFSFRTLSRAGDWKNSFTLASHDIKNSPEDYPALGIVSQTYAQNGDYKKAAYYAEQIMHYYPNQVDELNLATIYSADGSYEKAMSLYIDALKFGNRQLTYGYIARTTLIAGTPELNKKTLQGAINENPKNGEYHMYLAILDYRYFNKNDAKLEIQLANEYSTVPQDLYVNIMNGNGFTVNYLGNIITIK